MNTRTEDNLDFLNDPISLRITWDRLVSISEEAAATLISMAFSSIIREVGDYSCLLMDAQGHSLAQPKASVPVFIGTMPATVRHLLAKFPAETLKPGDSLITNDPWLGTGHLNDVTIVTPVFRDGELVAFTGSAAHMSDIGGSLNMGSSRDIYEEGFLIPPSKLIVAGEVNQQLLDLLLANVRSPDQVQGDLHAMLAANQIGADGLLALMDDLHISRVEPLAEKIHSLTENAMRKAILAVPDGRYEASVDIGDYEGDIHLHVAVIVEGSNVVIDYTGSSDESLFGSNCPMSFTYAYSVYPLKCLLEPHLPNNEGCFKSITVTAPEGSIANARPPCAVEMRNRVGHMAHAAIFSALAEVMPERVMGHSGSAPVTCDVFAGQLDDGRRFVESLCVNGGTGARPHADGIVTGFPGNMSSTPIELIESATPLLFLQKAIVPDSGGAGRYRGGLAQRMVIRNLGKFPLSHSMFYSRQKHPAQGVLGGQAGAPNYIAINGRQLEKPVGRHDVFPGDEVTIQMPGGGGKMPVAERAKEAIVYDLQQGYITAEGALRDYGFSLDNTEWR
ncbi:MULTISPECIES: hydantoinase B/oxoprolinase family protein [unclassified Brenneria]|uniref:hydantoinase B/oxoprolinase family protein n=1 Tax=unclassified Brenneria TaxID=2634434 RepID=UPI001552D6BF|nr:hydantoinase B/oxoprolinase family protein [Brenneria sp. hezel4-2-4]MEE3649945.1 hydantoinase B/oxoprolinase family protein [Brenneria sp. HEZEL_4_2_4]NPC99903.1 hydantoinase B/oxoprolinase family protein [Brenneria sp. hezel4-2-4]